MSALSSQPFEWLENIHATIKELDQNPQFGVPFAFPWDKLSIQLNEVFGKNLIIKPVEMRWLNQEQLFNGIGEKRCIIPITLSPIATPIYWTASEGDIKKLMGELLEIENPEIIDLQHEIYEGFSQFILMEVALFLEEIGYSKGCSPQVGKMQGSFVSEKEKNYFRIDVEISFQNKSILGFLFLPESFRNSWKKQQIAYFETKKLDLETSKKIPLEISLEVAKSEVSFKELSHAKEGDFIILDQCHYDPQEKSGRIILTLNNKPIFRAKIKEDGLKLLEYPLYDLTGASMAKNNDFDDEDDDLFSTFDDDEDEEDDEDNEQEDDELDSENLNGEDLNIEEDDEIEYEDETEEELSYPENKKKFLTEETSTEGENAFLKPEKVPLQITIELGRIKMTAYDLMNLQPGNLIETKVSPEQGVDLVLNGKKIGRGELVKMGEVIGVRILQL